MCTIQSKSFRPLPPRKGIQTLDSPVCSTERRVNPVQPLFTLKGERNHTKIGVKEVCLRGLLEPAKEERVSHTYQAVLRHLFQIRQQDAASFPAGISCFPLRRPVAVFLTSRSSVSYCYQRRCPHVHLELQYSRMNSKCLHICYTVR
jgi:hypothetical protein